ncbi:DEAD/DEAH box helicase [Nafulsella turpanensis]|uniref:DEAD/DEAH box helicase n=1 Tax=Nafulsella turpanensis TaxID=1265690 RepID=UPI00034BFD92|nr:DEAD/DEAH box helicase [Nafulsella turpanensis]
MATFSELGIADTFIKALKENNIFSPTEIQVQAIPFLLENGTDLIAQAQTGTGKTAAFGLPLLQKVDPDIPQVQALILTPTRELGQQIAKQLFRFTKFGPKIFTEAVYGGAPIENQVRALARPTHIVVATPGRLLDLLERKAIDLKQVKTVVLDEADEMLSMGFKKELDQILERTAGQRYTWLFSATMPPEIRNIINNYMSRDAYRIQLSKNQVVNQNIEHFYVLSEEKDKTEALLGFLKKQEEERGVIFCKTKAAAQTLAKQLLAKNIPAGAIQGDLLQKERDKVMRAFKNHTIRILVATDLAARGIDIANLSFVVHYQLPEQIDYYTHRSGRTARAGRKGTSLSIINPKELKNLQNIEKSLGIKIKETHM